MFNLMFIKLKMKELPAEKGNFHTKKSVSDTFTCPVQNTTTGPICMFRIIILLPYIKRWYTGHASRNYLFNIEMKMALKKNNNLV